MDPGVKPLVDNLIRFFIEFEKESDRGAVLIAASILDDQLLAMLRAFMVDSKVTTELLEGRYAPLGNFSTRISAAFALGLITQVEYNQLDIVRKIRNVFAHKWGDITFDNQKVGQLCANLPEPRAKGPKPPGKPRTRFDWVIHTLLLEFINRVGEIKKQRRTTGDWPPSIRYVNQVVLRGKPT